MLKFFILSIILGNPFVRSMVSSPLRVNQCERVNLLFQVAQFSDGTPGSNTVESVQLEQFRNGLSIANSTFSPNQQLVTATFTAFNSYSGTYFACKNLYTPISMITYYQCIKHMLIKYYDYVPI